MAENTQAASRFKIALWGPKKLREIFKSIEEAINCRTPKAGIGLKESHNPDGIQLSVETVPPADQSGVSAGTSSGNGGGSSTVIATEFITVGNTSDSGDEELLYSHGIGENRLADNGDSIRAVYGITISSGDAASNLSVRFGAGGDEGDLVIVDGNNMNLDANLTIRIEILIMRASESSFRLIASLAASTTFGDTSVDTQFVRCFAGPDLSGGSFADDLVLSVWGGGEDEAQVKAHTALIEYVPA